MTPQELSVPVVAENDEDGDGLYGTDPDVHTPTTKTNFCATTPTAAAFEDLSLASALRTPVSSLRAIRR